MFISAETLMTIFSSEFETDNPPLFLNMDVEIWLAKDLLYLQAQYVGFCLCGFQFSVPQIEYPLGGSSKKGSHV